MRINSNESFILDWEKQYLICSNVVQKELFHFGVCFLNALFAGKLVFVDFHFLNDPFFQAFVNDLRSGVLAYTKEFRDIPSVE